MTKIKNTFLTTSSCHGFSLVELLVVIIITGLLVGFLIPILRNARENVKRVACVNNLRQIYFAAEMYSQDNDGQWVEYHEGSIYIPESSYYQPTIQVNGEPDGLGKLYSKYLDDLDVLYCPAATRFKERRVTGFTTTNPDYFGNPSYTIITSYSYFWRFGGGKKFDDLKNEALVIDNAYTNTTPMQKLFNRLNNIYPNHRYGYNSLYGNGRIVWTNYAPGVY